MRILKLLNKKNLPILIFFCFFEINSLAQDNPIDIWNIEKKEVEKNLDKSSSNNINNENNQNFESIIYKMQTDKDQISIETNQNIESKSVKIIGIYDPDDYGLDINMWSNSDGDQLKNIFTKLQKIDLSEDAKEIMNISILTNAYFPRINITEKEFLSLKSNWLIKNSNLELIENYLIKNQIINLQPELTKYLVDEHLSKSNLKKACDIFLKNNEPILDNYLSKFDIYCLVYLGKKDEAQMILDLKKELGFEDSYFENKINYLIGLNTTIDKNISEKSVLDFHLAHMTNTEFFFEPNEKTKKIIWKYLSSSNLLDDIKQIDLSEINKISTIEKATHNKNYPEDDLFEIYERFQFNINQLVNAEESYKSLTNIEARALVYQKILLESEVIERLKLLKILKDLFKNEKIDKAFDIKLKEFLNDIDPLEVPDNLTSFYYTNIKIEDDLDKKIKFNNNIMHQSKMLNYFNGDYEKSKIEKDINNYLNKIKKDKKYFLSKKDIIFLESLRSDGIQISKKYDDLYEIDSSVIPTDIQVMINNNEIGAALLRIVEVIGQDKLERIDEDTIYFIISTLNQLNIDFIRNKILLKVLPLKV